MKSEEFLGMQEREEIRHMILGEKVGIKEIERIRMVVMDNQINNQLSNQVDNAN